MALSLTPQTQNGIMVWTPSTLLLHLLWSWQFLLACAGEAFMMFGIAFLSRFVAGLEAETPWWLWILFVSTGVLALLVVGEICLYANAQLSPNLYLGLQTGKLLYATLVFCLYLELSTWPENVDFWRVVVGIFMYCTPWILSFCLALLIKFSKQAPEKEESVENGNVGTAAHIRSTERTPLLANQIPGPRLSSQRVAVQRYPS